MPHSCRHRVLCPASVVLVCALSSPSTAQHETFKYALTQVAVSADFKPLQLGGRSINDLGEVIGPLVIKDAQGVQIGEQLLLWRPGQGLVDLTAVLGVPPLGSDFSSVRLNNLSQVVGSLVQTGTTTTQRMFAIDVNAGTTHFFTLGQQFLPSGWNLPIATNDSGQVVYSGPTLAPPHNSDSHLKAAPLFAEATAVLQQTAPQDRGSQPWGINDSGVTCGSIRVAAVGNLPQPVIWNGTVPTLLGGLVNLREGQAVGINDRGQVAVSWFDTGFGRHQSILTGGVNREFQPLAGWSWNLSDLNNYGQVLGSNNSWQSSILGDTQSTIRVESLVDDGAIPQTVRVQAMSAGAAFMMRDSSSPTAMYVLAPMAEHGLALQVEPYKRFGFGPGSTVTTGRGRTMTFETLAGEPGQATGLFLLFAGQFFLIDVGLLDARGERRATLPARSRLAGNTLTFVAYALDSRHGLISSTIRTVRLE